MTCSREKEEAAGSPVYLRAMRIAFDLDSTIYPILDAIALVPGGERVSAAACQTWESLPELCERDLGEVLNDAMQLEIATRVGAYPGAVETIAELAAGGVTIEVMTARDAALAEVTSEYLHAHGIAYDRLSISFDIDKVALCKQREIGVIVEDSPYTIAAAHGAGLSVYGLAHSYNRNVAAALGIELAPDWARLRDQLRAALRL